MALLKFYWDPHAKNLEENSRILMNHAAMNLWTKVIKNETIELTIGFF